MLTLIYQTAKLLHQFLLSQTTAVPISAKVIVEIICYSYIEEIVLKKL